MPFLSLNDLFKASDDVLASLAGGVVAIGNFDGVHKGHRVVLETALSLAQNENRGQSRVFAMTFEPHPRTVFKPEEPVFRLSPRREKDRLFSCMGLSGAVIVPFDRAFSQMTAEDFVVTLLVERLRVRHVVIGYDFHFGQGRRGTPEFLIEMGKQHGFAVSVVPAQKDEAGALVYSSTAIRAFLTKGEIEAANRLLGYRYFVSAEVVHGRKEGRELGYPTANMALAANSGLKHGIYAVQMRMDGQVYDAVASFGRRPMFDNGPPLLETFVFDFSNDLYGKIVEVVFFQYLRGEAHFDGVPALLEQMARDCDEARAVLKEARPSSLIDQALNAQDDGNFKT